MSRNSFTWSFRSFSPGPPHGFDVPWSWPCWSGRSPCAWLCASCSGSQLLIVFNTFAQFDTLLSGVLLALVLGWDRDRPVLSRWVRWLQWPLYAATIWLISQPAWDRARLASDAGISSGSGCAASGIVMVAVWGHGWLRAALSYSRIVWLGKISYGLYMYHEIALWMRSWIYLQAALVRQQGRAVRDRDPGADDRAGGRVVLWLRAAIPGAEASLDAGAVTAGLIESGRALSISGLLTIALARLWCVRPWRVWILGFAGMLRIETSGQLLGGNQAIRVTQEFGQVAPFDDAVEPDADPSARADVRRHKEAIGRGGHHRRLVSRGGLHPDGVTALAMMVVGGGVHREDLVPHAKRGDRPRLPPRAPPGAPGRAFAAVAIGDGGMRGSSLAGFRVWSGAGLLPGAT